MKYKICKFVNMTPMYAFTDGVMTFLMMVHKMCDGLLVGYDSTLGWSLLTTQNYPPVQLFASSS